MLPRQLKEGTVILVKNAIAGQDPRPRVFLVMTTDEEVQSREGYTLRITGFLLEDQKIMQDSGIGLSEDDLWLPVITTAGKNPGIHTPVAGGGRYMTGQWIVCFPEMAFFVLVCAEDIPFPVVGVVDAYSIEWLSKHQSAYALIRSLGGPDALKRAEDVLSSVRTSSIVPVDQMFVPV